MATNLTNNVISSIKIQDKEYKLKSIPFHGTATEWENSNYIPKQGEIIIYDAETASDSAKIKIGDGSTFAHNLPFEQTQPDWNQNDESAADYVKNRTHYITQDKRIIIPTTTDTYISDTSLNLNSMFGYETLYVTVDGVEYECTTYSSYYGDITIGDSRLLTYYDDEGNEVTDMSNPMDVPFCIQSWEDDGGIGFFDPSRVIVEYWITYPDSEEHTVELAVMGDEVYHTLDEKFIPNTIARSSKVTKDITTVESTLSKTIEEETKKLSDRIGKKADWLQNNRTNDDYVKNRTHWTEYEMVKEQFGWIYPVGPNQVSLNLDKCKEDFGVFEVGKTYLVTNVYYDEIPYESIAWQYDDNSVAIGHCEEKGHIENVPYLIITRPYPGNANYTEYDVYNYSDEEFECDIHEVIVNKVVQLPEKYIPDTIARTSDVEDLMSDKKDKDLIVTYLNGSHSTVTHSVAEINEVVNNGGTVKFQKDAELLNLLEVTADFATFYIVYVNINGKLQQKVVAISGNSIMLEQDDTYNYLDNNALKNYVTKPEIPPMLDDYVFITVDDIDTICGGAIQYAEDVMF